MIVVDYAGLKIEWNDKGDMSITRQSDATRIYISRTEWGVLLKIAELNGWPCAPPNCYLSD